MPHTTVDAIYIADILTKIRQTKPLIHNISNYVAMTFNANALLALNASPFMAHAHEEIREVTAISNALVINMGTLDSYWIKSMLLAMQAAYEKSIPIILDPVGVGTTSLRTKTAYQLLEYIPVQVIRANAAEIMALSGEILTDVKGVDSLYNSQQAYLAAHALAEKYQCVVVISGQQDYIIHSKKTMIVNNGVALMAQVTGMGCTASAVVAACCAVEKNYLLAATAAMVLTGVAGEMALSVAQGPGSFQACFLDALYRIELQDIVRLLKLNLQSC